jgi:hypothetical protein
MSFFLRTRALIQKLCIVFFKELKNIMKNIIRNRLALSTVVTTLIILVVSVLLAGVVTYFAINVTSTRVQEESLVLTKQHVWVNMDSSSVAAIMITNTGGRDVVISKFAVRGQDIDMATGAFYVMAAPTDNLALDLNYTTGTVISATSIFGGLAGTPQAPAAGNNLVLPSGDTVVVYINDPDSITVNDVGLTVAMTVFSSQAMYYKETNVQAAI